MGNSILLILISGVIKSDSQNQGVQMQEKIMMLQYEKFRHGTTPLGSVLTEFILLKDACLERVLISSLGDKRQREKYLDDDNKLTDFYCDLHIFSAF